MSITPDKAPETLLASDPNALFLQRTDEINELLDSGASLSGHERNCFFLNTGEGKFATASATSGFDFYDDARAVARTDWDHDGDLDLFFANRTAPRLRFLKNQGDRENNFIALRLIGTSSNRDAIGARVLLKSGSKTILRGLRAGEGFLGQSGKWLHFGLGEFQSIDSVTVHWPGGQTEIFSNLKANGWFQLRQGTGSATPWTPPEREVHLPEKPLELPIPTARAAVRLSSPMPIPRLHALDARGNQQPIVSTADRPLLVTLWASWCPACDASFTELAASSSRLREAGIDTLALSVNGLGEGDESTFEQAKAYLEKHKLPLTHQRAHSDLLHQLQLIANRIVAQNEPLPLPSSFLLDPNGRVIAFYRGPAPVEHLIKTATFKSDDPTAHFQAALPYAGKWNGLPRLHPVEKLVNEFIDAGFLESGLAFAKAHQNSFPGPGSFAEVFSRAGNRFADQGDFETAIAYYRNALAQDESSALIHFNLALALERQRKIPEALAEYEKAISHDPKITVAHLNRGAILARSSKTIAQGIDSLREAVRLNPNLAASHYHLGLALERTGQFQEAFQHYRQASLLAPDHFGNAMQLAHLYERSGQIKQALVEYQKIARIHPTNPQVFFQSGLASEKLKLPAQARDYYQQSLSLSPNYLPALNNLAYLLAVTPGLKDPLRSIDLASRAATLTQNQNPAVLDTLASAYLAGKQTEQALATLKKALRIAEEKKMDSLVKDLRKRISKMNGQK
jgi:tetratricopeptide (TPR) repeat protein